MRIWHLACFSVTDHLRSSKLLVEALLIAGFLLFFWDHPQQTWRLDFFLWHSFFLMLLAGVESYLFLGRAVDRRFHLVLNHIGTRRAALLGIFLAVALILGGVTLGFILAGAVFTSVLRETSVPAYLGGSLLLWLNLLTTVALCFLFSPLAMGSNLGWVALALVVFGFSRDAFLLGPGSGVLGGLGGLLHALLPPFYETINAAEGRLGWGPALEAGLHQMVYGALALALALRICQRRDLEPMN
jgi:hypothetical protein